MEGTEERQGGKCIVEMAASVHSIKPGTQLGYSVFEALCSLPLDG